MSNTEQQLIKEGTTFTRIAVIGLFCGLGAAALTVPLGIQEFAVFHFTLGVILGPMAVNWILGGTDGE